MPHTAICPRMPHETTQKSWSKHIMRSSREKESRLFFSMIRNSSQQPQDDDGWWSTLAVKLWMEIVRQMRVLEEKKHRNERWWPPNDGCEGSSLGRDTTNGLPTQIGLHTIYIHFAYSSNNFVCRECVCVACGVSCVMCVDVLSVLSVWVAFSTHLDTDT